MITLNIHHICQNCRAGVETWKIPQTKAKVFLRRGDMWPPQEKKRTIAEVVCPHCREICHGHVVLDNSGFILDVSNVLNEEVHYDGI